MPHFVAGEANLATSTWVIPKEERFPGLRAVMLQHVDEVAAIRGQTREFAQQPLLFLFLCFPWVADLNLLSAEQKGAVERRAREIQGLPFDGEAVRNQLTEILAADKHLRECCPSLFHLANYLDLGFITAAADAKRQGLPQDRISFAYDEFETSTYHQGPFRRLALSHLFNFEMDRNSAVFPGDPRTAIGDVHLERLDATTVPQILGESGYQAFLHPTGVGDYFIVEEEGASEVDDSQWMLNKRNKALFFAQALQYFQDGVIHVGYSVPYFLPIWVNQIRRSGLFFLGAPRRTPYESGKKMYRVDGPNLDRLARWWKAATSPHITDYLANKKGKLRQAIYRAGEYYEASHQRENNVDRLIALAIAVESLFSPSDKGELRFRIAQSTAQLVGTDPEKRKAIFDSVVDLYDRRSTLVHGSYAVEDYDAGTFVKAEEIDHWAGYVRIALLHFLTRYFRGDKQAPRNPVLDELTAANFDSTRGDALRSELDIEAFFKNCED